MNSQRYIPKFKDEAVRQVLERGMRHSHLGGVSPEAFERASK
jgi:transposase-like protein